MAAPGAPTAAAHCDPTAGTTTPLSSSATVSAHLFGMRSSSTRAWASNAVGGSSSITPASFTET